jgi:DNA invertase Pin-like site-specific DNA recombinase/peptidoglycan hydrolase-like protein with peptidoglycan-binding domain
MALACTLVLAGLPGTSIAAAQNAATVDDSRVLLARGAGYAGTTTTQEVRALQRTLRRLGWRPGPVDGRFGPRTERAVVRFQSAAGLVVDGIRGPRTAKALAIAARGDLSRGTGYTKPNGSRRVRALQVRLRRAGFDPGAIDGLFGPDTQAAVKRLQRWGGLTANGIVSQATRTLFAKNGSTPDTTRTRPGQEPAPDRPAAGQGSPSRSDAGSELPLARAMETAPFDSIDEFGQDTSGERGLLLLVGAMVALALAALVLLLLGRPVAQGALAAGRARIPSISQRLRGPVKAHMAGSSGHTAAVWVEQVQPPKLAPIASKPERGEDEPRNERGEDEPRTEPLPDGVRALGYVCVSDQESFDDPKLKAQMEAIDRLCEQRGWRLLKLVRDKEVASGKALERPGLGYALERMEAGEASCLIVARLQRLSRSVADLGRILEVIGRNGGRLIALDLGIDTATPEGRKAANVLVSVSGWERQRLAERTRQGLEAARAKGGAVGRPSVHDVPALKQWIVELRESGLTLQAIADRLNAEGVPTLRGGQKWRPSAVQAAAGYRRPPRRSRAVTSEEAGNGRGVE